MAVISFWSDKGGTGKTILTVMAASFDWPMPLPAVLVDLDPQGDTADWARRAGCPFHAPQSPEEAARLIQALEEEHTVLVDCPPGRLRNQPMAGVGVLSSDILIIPTGSGKPDLNALGRGIRAVEELVGKGASLKAGVVLNHFRETTRSRVVEEGLRLGKLPFLGRLTERAAYPEAFSEGRNLLATGGAASHEAKILWSNIASWVQGA